MKGQSFGLPCPVTAAIVHTLLRPSNSLLMFRISSSLLHRVADADFSVPDSLYSHRLFVDYHLC